MADGERIPGERVVGRTRHTELSVDEIADLQHGLSDLMDTFARRYWVMTFAARGGNWDLARYEWRESVKVLHQMAKTRPKYAEDLGAFERDRFDESARLWNPGTSPPSKPRSRRGLIPRTRTTRSGRNPTSGSGCRRAGRTSSMPPDPNDGARVVRGMGFSSRLGVRAATLNPCTPARQDLKSRAVGRAWLPPQASHRRPRHEPSRGVRGILLWGPPQFVADRRCGHGETGRPLCAHHRQ